jgi:methyltransferase (TIGR00027 family)
MLQVALEQQVPQAQRIIDDPLAYRFLPLALKSLVNLCRIAPLRHLIVKAVDQRGPGVRAGLLCRKRYIDEKLLLALNTGIRSVVILGAGFDTRAYRMPELASLQIYEVDMLQNIDAKKKTLQLLYGQIPDHVTFVAVDFDRQDLRNELQQAGYSEQCLSFFIWEGVTQYIHEKSVRKVFEFLNKAQKQSRLVFSYVREDFIKGEKVYGLEGLYHETRVKSRLWQFGLEPETVGAFLAQYGWEELEQVGSVEYEERYLKPVKRVMPVMEVERLVHAERKTQQ